VELRTDNGFICGISGFPETECATPVSDYVASASPQRIPLTPIPDVAIESSEQATDSTQTSSLAPVGTAVVIGLLAVAGFYFWRRRKP